MSRPMRDSGVEWIGPVPEGWRVERFKFIATAMRKGSGITKAEVFEDGDIPCIRYGEIYSRYANSFDRCFSKTRRECVSDPVYMAKGDIAFACTGEIVDEIGKNVLYLGESPCVVGGDILVASHGQDPSFLNYYLNCYTSQFQKSRGKAKLKVVHVRTSDIGNLLVLLPPLSEQRAIAAYLDAKCGEVDAAVVAARQAIEDYKALKKSLVFEAVTGKRGDVGLGLFEPCRGVENVETGVGNSDRIDRIDRIEEEDVEADAETPLRDFANSVLAPAGTENPVNPVNPVKNHDRPMRDSGVAWIGPVPEGWRMSRLRFLCSITTGDHNTQDANPDGQYPFYVRSPNVERSDDYTFEGPGILMAGDGAGAGRVFHLADGKYAVHQRVYRFYDFKEASAKYLWYYLGATFPFVMDKGSAQSTVPSVRLPMLMDHVVVFPDEQEQRAIADYLDAKCGAIDALVAEQEALVADLERYRKSLIFECVTGKRKVA